MRSALASAPNNAIAWARRAELELGLGDSTGSLESAQRAIELEPSLGYAHSVLGFVALRRLDVDGAVDAFERASALDQGAPLPQLGLALALMQRGDFVAGRQHLEVAVALDPSSSIVRSYMGKTYDAEHRAKAALRASSRSRSASTRPTLRRGSTTRSSSSAEISPSKLSTICSARATATTIARRSSRALRWMQTSRRAARARATCCASSGSSSSRWCKVGPRRQADPADYAAHRLLADVYSTEPRHELARVSELLTSQLLQPLNLTPIQPQLAQIGSLRADRTGPSELAFTEFSPLVTANGLRFEMSSVAGANDTFGDDLVVAGLHDRLSYSVGQFRYSSDGIRENNDLDEKIYNAFIQFSPDDRSSVQAELRSNEFEHGDLTMLFDPSIHSDARQNDSADTLRVGGRRRLDNGDTVFGTLVYQEDSGSVTFGPFSIDTRLYMHGADIQHIHAAPRWNVRSGILSMRQTGDVSGDTADSAAGPDESGRAPGFGLLVRGHRTVTPSLMLTAGAAADSVKDAYTDLTRIDPKLGVTWMANDALTLRAAAFKTLSYNFSTSKQNAQPRLEPIAGRGLQPILVHVERRHRDGLWIRSRRQILHRDVRGHRARATRRRSADRRRLDGSGAARSASPASERSARSYLLLDPAADRKLQCALRGRRLRRGRAVAFLFHADEAASLAARGQVLRPLGPQRGPARLALPPRGHVHVAGRRRR